MSRGGERLAGDASEDRKQGVDRWNLLRDQRRQENSFAVENLANGVRAELDKAIDQLGKDDVLAIRDILIRRQKATVRSLP